MFEIDDMKAWKSVLISVSSYALGLFMITKAPWYLLPLAWAWTGTAVTGVSSACAFSLVGAVWDGKEPFLWFISELMILQI